MLKRYFFAADYFCKGKNVLDSCCGLGWGTYIISKFAKKVTAFDRSPEIIKFCKRTWDGQNIQWQIADALDMSNIENDQFDVVVAMETIEHFGKIDGEGYIRSLVNKLKTGGHLIGASSFPQTGEDAQKQCLNNPYHLNIFTYQEINALLSKYLVQYRIIDNWMFIGIK